MNLKINANTKSSYLFKLHHFSSTGELSDFTTKKLGIEFDFTYSRTLNKWVSLAASYSHFFETKALNQLRNVSNENTNHWAWLMFTFKPTLYQSLKPKQ